MQNRSKRKRTIIHLHNVREHDKINNLHEILSLSGKRGIGCENESMR